MEGGEGERRLEEEGDGGAWEGLGAGESGRLQKDVIYKDELYIYIYMYIYILGVIE